MIYSLYETMSYTCSDVTDNKTLGQPCRKARLFARLSTVAFLILTVTRKTPLAIVRLHPKWLSRFLLYVATHALVVPAM